MAGNLITDRVKQLVRMRGPVIPSQISKEIGTNILMASAILSELASKNDVKISSVKVGGTPLYYVPGQEAKLQNYLTSLHQKEKEAFEELKVNGVLRDSELDPATRVALRQLKDFAKPLNASIDGESLLFWKWYLLPNEEAEPAIKRMLGLADAQVESVSTGPSRKSGNSPIAQSAAAELRPSATWEKATANEQTTAATTEQVAGTDAQQKMQVPPQPLQTAQATLQQTIAQAPPQVQVALQIKPARKKAPAAVGTDFAGLIADFFSANSIEVESSTAASRSEAQHVVLVPSPVGKLRYYCIAKNKKTCTDSDISSAIVHGQLKKLPVLLLTKGELSKKAQELLSKEIGAVVVKKI